MIEVGDGPPVQFVWGRGDDPFGGSDIGRRAARIVPNATFELVPGGHVPWISDATAVADVVQPFLDQHATPASEGLR